MRGRLTIALATLAACASSAFGGMDEAKRWIEQEFQPSTLTKEQQLKEMEWFVNAAKPFKGMEINVLSETIPTHEYESKTLTKAFEEITGIKVNHQLLGEGEVVQAVQTQMQTNRNLYDAYINDSDLIGTHSRLQSAVNLTRLDEGRWQGRHAADARCRRLHRQVLHDRAGRQALAASGPAVRQPLLVPPRLVRTARAEEAVQGHLRLRTGRSASIGPPTRTSPNSSPCMSRRSMASASTATWTTASALRISAGA